MWRLEFGFWDLDFGVGRIYRRKESGAGKMGEAACNGMGMGLGCDGLDGAVGFMVTKC